MRQFAAERLVLGVSQSRHAPAESENAFGGKVPAAHLHHSVSSPGGFGIAPHQDDGAAWNTRKLRNNHGQS
jgi:hypothetical protein